MNPLYAFPPVAEQILRALARYPTHTAFAWPGGTLSCQGATDLIGRIQAVFMRLGLKPGTRAASSLPTARTPGVPAPPRSLRNSR